MKSRLRLRRSSYGPCVNWRVLASTLLLIRQAQAAPDWWTQRAVLTGSPPNDYAVVNQGQLKQIAKQAMLEIDAHLPGGADDAVHQMVGSWSTPTAITNDYSAANLGQLKALAQPFYDRLIITGYTSTYPWNASFAQTNDYAVANIGQVKNLFAFDLTLDSDGDQLPDWWEQHYFGHIGVSATAQSPGGSGLSNLQTYSLALNPSVPSTKGIYIPDGWSVAHGLDPHDSNLAHEDPDHDGLSNGEEYLLNSNPTNPDTDGDGIPDGEDLYPLVPDPARPEPVRVVVPSWEYQLQQSSPDYKLVDYTKIEVRWAASQTNTTGYKVERRENCNVWHQMATVSSGVASYSDQSLVANRHYQYRVTAVNDVAGGHAQSGGAVADYDVPLALNLLTKLSYLKRTKGAWSTGEFTGPQLPASNPPKYYTGYITKGDCTETYTGETKTWHLAYALVKTPRQHLETGSSSYSWTDVAPEVVESVGRDILSKENYNWSTLRRGRDQETAAKQASMSMPYIANYTYKGVSWNDNSTQTGSYLLNDLYEPNSLPAIWTGNDFDLKNGKLKKSGSSSYGFSDAHTVALGTASPNTAGVWSGTYRSTYTADDGTVTNSNQPLNTPAWELPSGINATNDWFTKLVSKTHTLLTYADSTSQSNGYTKASTASEELSDEYKTETFIKDVIYDLPDYPKEWSNYYYDWIWNSNQCFDFPFSSYGHAAQSVHQYLAKSENSFEVSKELYKFKANPSAPCTVTWDEVFVPEDDPETTDIDESEQIVILNTRSWTLGDGQNESPEYELDASTERRNGSYTIMVKPVNISAVGVGEAGKTGLDQALAPGLVVPVNDEDMDGDGIVGYADGFNLNGQAEDDDDESYGFSFAKINVNFLINTTGSKVKITYDASDPAQVIYDASTGVYNLPAGGKIRLWLQDSGEMRNPLPVKQGGSFLAPGEYDYDDLHSTNGITICVEAVQASNGIADIPIKVEVAPTESLGYIWSDEIRVTAAGSESPYRDDRGPRGILNPVPWGHSPSTSSTSSDVNTPVTSASPAGGPSPPPFELPWLNPNITQTNGTVIAAGLVVKKQTLHIHLFDWYVTDGDIIDVYINRKKVNTVRLNTYPGAEVDIALDKSVNIVAFEAVTNGKDPARCTLGVEFDGNELVNINKISKPSNGGPFKPVMKFDLFATPLSLIVGLTGFAPQGAAQFEIGFAQIHMKNTEPLSRNHAARAIARGKPTLLTVDRANRITNSKASLANSGFPGDDSKGDRDEYPQAMFHENAGVADVEYVNANDNRRSGRSVGGQSYGEGLVPGYVYPRQPALFNDGDMIEIVLDP